MKIWSLIILLVTISICGKTFGQKHRNPFLTGYEYASQKYFDSVSKKMDCGLASIKNNMSFFAVFDIQSSGKTGPIEFVPIPGETIPQAVKSYVASLIATTDRQWNITSFPDNKTARVVCEIMIVGEQDSAEERFETVMKIPRYPVEHPNDADSRFIQIWRYVDRINILIKR